MSFFELSLHDSCWLWIWSAGCLWAIPSSTKGTLPCSGECWWHQAFCLAFCALPFAGFGKFVQYCPGTWCFIQMVHEKRSLSVLGFSVLYSTLMALLVLATVLCNLGAMHNLYTMHKRLRRHPRCCLRDHSQTGSGHRQESLHPLEELDHLLLLALMTVLFTVCSLPFIDLGIPVEEEVKSMLQNTADAKTMGHLLRGSTDPEGSRTNPERSCPACDA